MWPLLATAKPGSGAQHLFALMVRALSYMVYIYQGEKLWRFLLPSYLPSLLHRPEKTVRLLISLPQMSSSEDELTDPRS